MGPGQGPLPAYMPELDGLRAVAILTVIFFHLRLPYCSLGWSGVYLFFVLSGFLITGILLEAKQEEHYFRTFYIRRTLRIAPIYYLTLTFLAVLAYRKGWAMSDLGWYLIYGQNYVLGVKEFAAQFPAAFNHSWSLAIEEQFYLLWPLAVLRLSRRSLISVCIFLIAAAPLFRMAVAASTNNPSLVFTPLICAADSLAIVALLSLCYHGPVSQRPTRRLGYTLVGLGGVATTAITLRQGLRSFWTPGGYLASPSVNHFLYTAMGILFAGCIVTALQQKGVWSSILRIPFLMHLGRISYGLYMYHWPLLLTLPWALNALGVEGLRARYYVPLYLATTYLVAVCSWRLLERPLGALKRHFAYH